MKSIMSGVGFLVLGLWVDDMLEKLGLHLDLGWWSVVLVAIGIALIIWGAIPSKVKDWSKERIGVIWPWGYEALDNLNSKTRILRRFFRRKHK